MRWSLHIYECSFGVHLINSRNPSRSSSWVVKKMTEMCGRTFAKPIHVADCATTLPHCKDFSANTAQEKGDRRKRTSDRARTRDLHSFAELQPHEPSVPAANPSSPIALCTGRRCAAIQRPLEDLRLEAGTVCDGNGLYGYTKSLKKLPDVRFPSIYHPCCNNK